MIQIRPFLVLIYLARYFLPVIADKNLHLRQSDHEAILESLYAK